MRDCFYGKAPRPSLTSRSALFLQAPVAMKGPKRLGLKGKRKEDVDCESGGIPLKKLIAGGAVIAILAVLALSFIPQPEFSLGSSNSLADRLAGRGLSMGKIYKHDRERRTQSNRLVAQFPLRCCVQICWTSWWT